MTRVTLKSIKRTLISFLSIQIHRLFQNERYIFPFSLDSKILGYYRSFRSKRRNTSAAYASTRMFLVRNRNSLRVPLQLRDTLPFSPPPRSKLTSIRSLFTDSFDSGPYFLDRRKRNRKVPLRT